MSEDWEKELKGFKEQAEKDTTEMCTKERELHDKYGPDKKKILDLIQSQLEPVVKTFRDESGDKIDQPGIERYESGIRLKLPLVHESTHYGLALSFNLSLTESGWMVNVKQDLFDSKNEKAYSTLESIPSPVDLEAVRGMIRGFIESRSQLINRLEEKSERYRREHGI